MLIHYIILAFAVSIDSLGIGITYGLRNTHILDIAKIILFLVSITITSIGIFLGGLLSNIFTSYVTSIIGAVILVFMGLWIIFQNLKKDNDKKVKKSIQKKKIYNLFIKPLGITIKIIKDPISSDMDSSKHIDAKEALYLGFALSLDALCVGIGSSAIGFNSFIFSFFVAIFQLFFLSFGRFLGCKISSISNIPYNVWSILSGILLTCIGISKVFIMF